MADFKTGDKFECDYPFQWYCNDSLEYGEHKTDEGWAMGCRVEDVDINPYESDIVFYADGLGSIEFEVLAVAEMPRKYQDRVLYTIKTTTPDGNEKKFHKAFTATMAKFKAMIVTPYRADYEVIES